MRVSALQVKNLFGVFNHEIPLTSPERVTIIHGPNGFGKTVMLKMIASLARGDAGIFERVPFDEFRILFRDGSAGIIRNREESKTKDAKGQSKLIVSIIDPQGKVTHSTSHPVMPDVPSAVLDRVDRYLPNTFRRFEDGWRDSSGQFFSLADILRRFTAAASAVPKKYRPQVLGEIAQDIKVFLSRHGASMQRRRSIALFMMTMYYGIQLIVMFLRAMLPRCLSRRSSFE